MEYFTLDLLFSLSKLSTTQWGYIVFGIMIFGAIIFAMGEKSKGKTESFRETLHHDKLPVIGLFIVFPIIIAGYIWAFFVVF